MQRAMAQAAAVVAGMWLAAVPALAQDALKVAPGVFTEVLNNSRVRVLEANLKPAAKVATHSHPDHLLYMLAEGTLVLRPAGRRPYEITLAAGEALFLEAQTRSLANESEAPVRVLIIELKAPPAATGRRGRPAKPKAPAKK